MFHIYTTLVSSGQVLILKPDGEGRDLCVSTSIHHLSIDNIIDQSRSIMHWS